MSGKEFLESVDQVFDNAAKVLKLSPSLSNQIKSPNATYKVNFGVRINNQLNNIIKKIENQLYISNSNSKYMRIKEINKNTINISLWSIMSFLI